MNLSKSRIIRYLNCPKGYMLDHEPGYVREEPEDGSPLKIGTDVHELFEWYYKQPDAAKIKEPYEVSMWKIFARNDKSAEYVDFVDNFIEFNKDMIADRGVPGYMPVDIEVDLTDDDLKFRGIIDVVFETEEGLVLLDYKTGKRAKPITDYRLELVLYKILYEKITGKTIRYVGIYFPKVNEIRMAKVLKPGEERSDKEPVITLDDELFALSTMDEVRESIEAGYFPPNPSFLCNYCEHSNICEQADL